MTRVNSDIDPAKLHRRHLIAEYREITMVPASLRRSLRTLSVGTIIDRIPANFTLGKGHVTFFYDKMTFLAYRFNRLCSEIEGRGYKTDRSRGEAFEGFDPIFNGMWIAKPEDDALLLARINERIAQKPHLYT
jgi:deoxyribonuclease (pyrimidine dimer)